MEGDDLAKAITEKQTELASATGLRIEQIMAEPPSETTGSSKLVFVCVCGLLLASIKSYVHVFARMMAYI